MRESISPETVSSHPGESILGVRLQGLPAETCTTTETSCTTAVPEKEEAWSTTETVVTASVIGSAILVMGVLVAHATGAIGKSSGNELPDWYKNR